MTNGLEREEVGDARVKPGVLSRATFISDTCVLVFRAGGAGVGAAEGMGAARKARSTLQASVRTAS
jgi:hypothetical protein